MTMLGRSYGKSSSSSEQPRKDTCLPISSRRRRRCARTSTSGYCAMTTGSSKSPRKFDFPIYSVGSRGAKRGPLTANGECVIPRLRRPDPERSPGAKVQTVRRVRAEGPGDLLLQREWSRDGRPACHDDRRLRRCGLAASSFRPIRLFNKVKSHAGRFVDYDIILDIQHNETTDSERGIVPMPPEDFVHPSQMVHQYTMFRRFPWRGTPLRLSPDRSVLRIHLSGECGPGRLGR